MRYKEKSVVFTPDAVRHLSFFSVHVQKIVTAGIRKHPVDNDPLGNTRNKFRLQRASPLADYELRIESWRVFYRIEHNTVNNIKIKITVVGEKQGNKLMIEGKEILL